MVVSGSLREFCFRGLNTHGRDPYYADMLVFDAETRALEIELRQQTHYLAGDACPGYRAGSRLEG